jgi:hypothetical protein
VTSHEAECTGSDHEYARNYMSDEHRANSYVHTKTFAFPLPKTLARYASICGCISYLDLMTATFIVNGG